MQRIKIRSMRNLKVSERLQIVKMAVKRELTYEEIAVQFKVKAQLISDLVKSLKKHRTLFINKKKNELRKKLQKEAIKRAIENRLRSEESIWSAKNIADQIRRDNGLKVSQRLILQTMRKEYRLSYRRIKRVPFTGNSE